MMAAFHARVVAGPRAFARASWIVGMLAATVAAEIALLPVSTSVFWRVGLAGPVSNLVAIPAMAVIQIAGLAMNLFAGWCEPVARAAAACAALGAWALGRSSFLIEWLPWLTWRVPPPSLVVVALFYLSLIALFRTSSRTRLRWCAAGVLSLSAFVIAVEPLGGGDAPASGWLRMTAIDVGQGDSILIQSPGGHSLLVDAGGAPGAFDIGERVVTPTLWAQGVRRLEWLAFTHPDLDHIGGTRSTMEIFRAREVWEGIPVVKDARRQALQEEVARDGGVWRVLQRGDRMSLRGVELTVLHPALADWERQRSRNDDSLVLRVRFDECEILLTGDISEETERALVSAPDDASWSLVGDAHRPPIRILKVAHHGSRTSSSAAFLDAYRPTAAVISAGRGNAFGHPAPEVLRRLAASGAYVFRTDIDGAVIIDTDGHVARLHTMKGQSLTISARNLAYEAQ